MNDPNDRVKLMNAMLAESLIERVTNAFEEEEDKKE